MSKTIMKPYLIRAIHEWCIDNGSTPYLLAKVDASVRVPMQFVKNGRIILNVSFEATSELKIDEETISFSTRFGGVPQPISIGISNIVAIYARESGRGVVFNGQGEVTIVDDGDSSDPEEKSIPSNREDEGTSVQKKKPILTRVK